MVFITNLIYSLFLYRTTIDDIFTVSNGDRAAFVNYGIMVTDGLSTDREATFAAAAEVHASGQARMLAVGVDVKGLASRLVVKVKLTLARSKYVNDFKLEQYSRSNGRCVSVNVYDDKVVMGRSCCC